MRMQTQGIVGFAPTILFCLKFNQAPTLGGRFPRPGRWASMSSSGVNAKWPECSLLWALWVKSRRRVFGLRCLLLFLKANTTCVFMSHTPRQSS
jgi:hypothetical protein